MDSVIHSVILKNVNGIRWIVNILMPCIALKIAYGYGSVMKFATKYVTLKIVTLITEIVILEKSALKDASGLKLETVFAKKSARLKSAIMMMATVTSVLKVVLLVGQVMGIVMKLVM